MPQPKSSVSQRSSSARTALESAVGPGYWLVPVLRAVPAIVVGLIITFVPDHSPRIGLISFGVFAVVTGVVLAVGTLRTVTDGVIRGTFLAQAVIAVLAGGSAVALWSSGVGVLLFIVTVYAALTAVLELYAGIRSRGASPSRDWLTVGGYTAVAAIVFVLIPPDPVLATGLIGVYAMILGVFLVIAGLSQKWADKPGSSDPVEGKVSP